jgi:immunity protein 53 of polymorphic toxin system
VAALVDLAGTGLEQRQLERQERRRGADDWLIVWRDGSAYKSACGPRNLSDAIERFLEWAELGAADQPDP